MVKTAIFGASGYTGAALVELVCKHPKLTLSGIYVSENSRDAGKTIQDIHTSLAHLPHYELIPTTDALLEEIAQENAIILLATPHEASHDFAPKLLSGNASVFDLSGAYRLDSASDYSQYYGFEHRFGDWLSKAVYGLAEHMADDIAKAQLIAVPGCYPTASLSALLPLQKAGLLDSNTPPVINAVSGVSGAGRKAALTNSFCEVSLQAYGVFTHRHAPEISQQLNQSVIFTPHLGSFKRGILATITAKLNEKNLSSAPTSEDLNNRLSQAFADCYADKQIIRLLNTNPKVDDVAHTPFCDIAWHVNPDTGYIIVSSAIDNLLKGAASQAIQCINIKLGLPDTTGLLEYAS